MRNLPPCLHSAKPFGTQHILALPCHCVPGPLEELDYHLPVVAMGI